MNETELFASRRRHLHRQSVIAMAEESTSVSTHTRCCTTVRIRSIGIRWLVLVTHPEVAINMAQSKSIFDGDNIWDEASHMYRPRTAWDSGPSLWKASKVFYQLIVPQCDATGYHPRVHNATRLASRCILASLR